MPKKTEREDLLGFFTIHSVAELQKKLKDPLVEKKLNKSRTVPKKSKGKRGNFFGFSFGRETFLDSVPWANRYMLASSQPFEELLVELFRSLQVVFKKTLTKSHDYSRLFS